MLYLHVKRRAQKSTLINVPKAFEGAAVGDA